MKTHNGSSALSRLKTVDRKSRFTHALLITDRSLYNMAQSTMACSPFGVHFFWDKSHQPELDWEKRLATVKLAIMVKEIILVDNSLQPKPENEELDYPTEPNYEPADNKTKSHIYLSLGAQATNIFHQRFPNTNIQNCTTDALVEQLKKSFHTNKERNIWQISILQMPTKRRRILRSISLSNQEICISMQLGSLRRKPGKKYFHTRHEQPINPNGSAVRRKNPFRNTTKCTITRKRTREPTKNDKHKHKPKYIKPMVQKNTIYKTTKQSTYSPSTQIRTNTRLPTLRQ